MRLTLPWAITGALLWTAGCSGAEPEPARRTEHDGVVAELIGASSDRRSLEYVEREAASCMRSAGFDYEEEPVADEATHDPASATREDAAELGFGISTAPEETATVDADDGPNSATFAALTPAERDAWLAGVPRCRDAAYEAEAALLEDTLGRLPRTVQDEVTGLRSYATTGLAPAVAEWSTCMEHRGWSTDHPFTLLQELSDEFGRLDQEDEGQVADFRERERAMAVDDHDCATEHLFPAFDQALDELETQVEEILHVDSVYER